MFRFIFGYTIYDMILHRYFSQSNMQRTTFWDKKFRVFINMNISVLSKILNALMYRATI